MQRMGEFLGRTFGGLPLWGWGVIVIGGVALALFVPKLLNRGGGSAGASSNAGGAGAANDPNIDPVTGVPYAIESAINPATGLPAYYGGAGVTNGSAQSGSAGQTADALSSIYQTIQPAGQGSGYSDNFWVGSSNQGETFAMATNRLTNNQAQDPSFFLTYRNNPDILADLARQEHYMGNLANLPLPAGTRISL